MHEDDFAVSRGYNNPLFIRYGSLWVTEKIEGEEECSQGDQQEDYFSGKRKKQGGCACEKREEKNFSYAAGAVGSKHLFSSRIGYFMISPLMIIIYLVHEKIVEFFSNFFCPSCINDYDAEAVFSA